MKNNFELLAPAGDMEKLKTALHFGADAVYFAGKKFGLRAFASNFEDLAEPINYCHERGKKAYITINIYPRNNDLDSLEAYIKEVAKLKPDGVIVSDIGIMNTINRVAPDLDIHISTQANTTNVASALAYAEHFNAKRVVLARELPLNDVEQITRALMLKGVETEVFVHGAMCISYSGRCLLSNYLTGRDSNRGECVQPCRYSYSLTENFDDASSEKFKEQRQDNHMEIMEDNRGTYILNSKDMCLIEHIEKIMSAGVKSFKIEGRMKSPYYLGVVVNAYRRAIDAVLSGKEDVSLKKKDYVSELEKCSHRKFTTGFMVDDGAVRQNYETSHQTQTTNFLGIIKDKRPISATGQFELLIEMRNKFAVGDEVEMLSPTNAFNKKFKIVSIKTLNEEKIDVAKNVQARLWVGLELAGSKDKSGLESINLLSEVLVGDIIRG